MPRKFTNKSRIKKDPAPLPEQRATEVTQLHPRQKWWLYGLMSFLVLFVLTLSLLAITTFIYINRFTKAAMVDISSLHTAFSKGMTEDAFGLDHQVTFLLLGLDTIGEQRGNALLTDTIMLATVNANGQVLLLSIPRDLWVDRLKTKVNALYYYGEKERIGGGTDYAKQILMEITGVQIDYVLTLDLEAVRKAVDLVGGIEVEVPESFTDTEYPREADLSSTDPAVLYRTVRFTQGTEHMNGERVLEFIRSRKSETLDQGTDNARQERQQLVLQALTKHLMRREQLLNPTLLGQLYLQWKSTMGKEIPDWVLLAIGRQYYGQPLTIQTITIPSTYDTPTTTDILYNPPISKYNQWVYEPQDPTWQSLHTYLDQYFWANI